MPAEREFVIVGYGASEAAGGIGALLLAEADDGGLRYVGRVGTGFSTTAMQSLHARLEALADQEGDGRAAAGGAAAQGHRLGQAGTGRRGRIWQPDRRRHPAPCRLQGLRTDKAEDESAAPAPEPPPQAPRKRYVTDADLAQVWVTNPDRVMFGEGGPTKLELALYYARVGDWMLPELIERPVSLLRCPTGKSADCFFQRHAMAGMPDVIKRIPLREEGSKKRADYLYVEDARGLLALAQFGAVEFHPGAAGSTSRSGPIASCSISTRTRACPGGRW